MSDETPPPPFVKYTRTVEQTKVVAEVTTENIWQIAAAAKASVRMSTRFWASCARRQWAAASPTAIRAV